MTDQELYELHLAALNWPKKKYGGEMIANYRPSVFRRVLTLFDAFLLFCGAMTGIGVAFAIWCLIGVVLCAFNLNFGPLSLSAYLVNWYLDRVPMPLPKPEVLRTGSPESIFLIADYLLAPVISEANAYIARCESEEIGVSRLIQEAIDVEEMVVESRSTVDDEALLWLYDRSVTNAKEAVSSLTERRSNIESRRTTAKDNLASLQRQLLAMKKLAGASSRLRIVLSRALPFGQEQDEAAAYAKLDKVCGQIQAGNDLIGDLQRLAKANARAMTEVGQLSRAL